MASTSSTTASYDDSVASTPDFTTELVRSIQLERRADMNYNRKRCNRRPSQRRQSIENSYREILRIRKELLGESNPSLVDHYERKYQRKSFGKWQRSAYKTGLKDLAKGLQLETTSCSLHSSTTASCLSSTSVVAAGKTRRTSSTMSNNESCRRQRIEDAIEIESGVLGYDHPHIIDLKNKLKLLVD